MSSIFKKGIFALFVRFFGALSNFVLSIYIARYLTKEDYGEYQFLITLVAGGSVFARLGMDTYLMSKVPGEKIERKIIYALQNSIIVVLIGSIALSVLSFLGYLFFYKNKISINTISLICISLIPYSNFMFISSIEKVKENINRSLCISNIFPPVLMFFVIELTKNNADKLNNIVAAYLLSSLLVFLFSLLILIRGERDRNFLANFNFNFNHVCLYFKRGIKYVLHALMAYLLLWVDLIIIGLFLGGEYIADYSVASRVTLIILLAMSVYDGIAGPIIIRSYKNNTTNVFIKKIIKIFFITITFVSFFALVMIVFSEYIIPMYGDEYMGSIDLARILIVAYAIKGMASLPGYVLIAMNKVIYINRILTISLIINIAMSYYLMMYYSTSGVATGTLMASFVMVVASYYTMICKLKEAKVAL